MGSVTVSTQAQGVMRLTFDMIQHCLDRYPEEMASIVRNERVKFKPADSDREFERVAELIRPDGAERFAKLLNSENLVSMADFYGLFCFLLMAAEHDQTIEVGCDSVRPWWSYTAEELEAGESNAAEAEG